jgi:transcriptional regulator with XRE-family HTH domain
MDYLGSIGQKLEKIRKLKGFSQEYVADKLKISQNSYSKIERGETKVTSRKLSEICEALEIDTKILQNFDPLQEFRHLAKTEEIPGWFSKIFNTLDNVTKLYEDLILEKDARIKQLEDVNIILKNKQCKTQ